MLSDFGNAGYRWRHFESGFNVSRFQGFQGFGVSR
jgi:hypothetical protein